MKLLLSIIVLYVILSSSRQAPSCEKLANGIYLVKFDTILGKRENYKLKIYNTRYAIYYIGGDSSSGNLEWGNFCDLNFEPDIKINPDTLSSFDKALYNLCGSPYFEILNTVDNTTTFINRCNPHVMNGSGVLIKQDD